MSEDKEVKEWGNSLCEYLVLSSYFTLDYFLIIGEELLELNVCYAIRKCMIYNPRNRK